MFGEYPSGQRHHQAFNMSAFNPFGLANSGLANIFFHWTRHFANFSNLSPSHVIAIKWVPAVT